MTDHDALLKAIAENPDEDTPRLAYADWLDESGSPANAARAEFIRVQCELARLPADAPVRADLRRREAELWVARRHEWKALVPEVPGIGWRGFARGFLTVLDAENMATFVSHAEELFAATPVQSVRILGADPVVTAELAAVPRLGWLRELDLTACRGWIARSRRRGEWTAHGVLTDDDVMALAASPGVANLRVLRLAGNEITHAGARAIIRSPFLKNLRRLEINRIPGDPARSRPPLTEEVMAELEAAFPDAEIR